MDGAYRICASMNFIDSYGWRPVLYSGILQNLVPPFVFELGGGGKFTHNNELDKLAFLNAILGYVV